MSAPLRFAGIGVLLAVLAATASAETVYRCGSSYSLAPCTGASAVDVGETPDAAQRAEARAVAERERRLAAELARDRHERERARPAAAASLSPKAATSAPARKTAHAAKKQRRDGDERDFVAVVPTSTKK
jgi:hypothetical protein|nr:hypothetical protein [Caldimonas sp.]